MSMPHDSADRPTVAPPLIRVGLRAFLELGRRDVIAVVLLVLLAFAIRFASPVFLPGLDHPFSGQQVALWGIGYPYNAGECTDDVPIPPGVSKTPTPGLNPGSPPTAHYCGYVFDEIYFPNDAAKDLHQPAVTYFDPEPPLTKLLMTPPLQFFGFNTWTWRLSTAFFGSLLAGLMYLIALRLRRDRFFASVAGILVCIDGLALVESRTGVIDIIAIFWAALLYYAFLLHWQARTKRQWRATLYFMAGAMGLAFAAKLTALAPTLLIGGLITTRLLERARPAVVWGFVIGVLGVGLVGALAFTPGILIKAGFFVALVAAGAISPIVDAPIARLWSWLHRLSTRRDIGPELWRQAAGGGRGLAHYGGAILLVGVIFCCSWSRFLTVPQSYYRFVSCSPSAGLQGDQQDHVTTVPTKHILGTTLVDPFVAVNDIYGYFAAGLNYHSTECHGHPYASRWYTWPLMEHPVLFYYSGSDTDVNGVANTASITDMGNPAIWWPGIAALLFCIWRMLTGPMWWRVSSYALGITSIIGMWLTFHHAEQPDVTVGTTLYTLPAHPGPLFYLAMAGVGVFGVIALVGAVFGRRFVPGFIVAGYLLAWMMWVPGNEARVLFFYHALGLFLMMVLAVAYMLTAIRRVPWRIAGRTLTLAPVAYGLLGMMVAGFIFFYPVWTAEPLPPSDHGMRVWADTW